MSSKKDFQLSSEAVALVSAALRHARDADHLASPGEHTSPDQAYHLAGFGPECARKATLLTRWLDQAVGHDFGELGEVVLDLATALDPVALRYQPMDFKARYPDLAAWERALPLRANRHPQHGGRQADLPAGARGRRLHRPRFVARWTMARW